MEKTPLQVEVIDLTRENSDNEEATAYPSLSVHPLTANQRRNPSRRASGARDASPRNCPKASKNETAIQNTDDHVTLGDQSPVKLILNKEQQPQVAKLPIYTTINRKRRRNSAPPSGVVNNVDQGQLHVGSRSVSNSTDYASRPTFLEVPSEVQYGPDSSQDSEEEFNLPATVPERAESHTPQSISGKSTPTRKISKPRKNQVSCLEMFKRLAILPLEEKPKKSADPSERSSVYIMRPDNSSGLLKIGKSENSTTRAQQLEGDCKQGFLRLSNIHSSTISSKKLSCRQEKLIHRILSPLNVKPKCQCSQTHAGDTEYFKIDEKTAIETIAWARDFVQNAYDWDGDLKVGWQKRLENDFKLSADDLNDTKAINIYMSDWIVKARGGEPAILWQLLDPQTYSANVRLKFQKFAPPLVAWLYVCLLLGNSFGVQVLMVWFVVFVACHPQLPRGVLASI